MGGQSSKALEVGQSFVDACEKGKGWSACSEYALEDAHFSCQAVDALPGPKVTECKTVKQYCDWMQGVVKEMGAKATYKITSKSFDADAKCVVFTAVFAGYSDYVYILEFCEKTGKIKCMKKVWNDRYLFVVVGFSEFHNKLRTSRYNRGKDTIKSNYL